MIKVRQVIIDIEEDNEEFLKEKVASKLKTNKNAIKSLEIVKKSLDARKKPQLYFIYEVNITVDNEKDILKRCNSNDVLKYEKEEYKFIVSGTKKLENKIVIVGAGPAGLLCAYLLCENGYKPLIIERGKKVEERVKDIEEFWNNNKLNINSNVQFGEGGAGTFSDGKLNTLIKQTSSQKKVFDIFVECGAPKEILYESKPHIGTDKLRKVIINMRNKIIDMGGTFKYSTTLTDLIVEKDSLKGIVVNDSETIATECLVLAIGHSARDTFKMLANYLKMESKPFAVGIRIQHKQEDINLSQYGTKENVYGPASYKLTYKTKDGRGVYSFCMCPGGLVVNASSEEGKIAINGMSNYMRDEKNANSAIVVTVDSQDYGTNLFDGMEFQRKLEENAYKVGNGNIPVTLYGDYKSNKLTRKIGDIEAIFKGKYTLANINSVFPKNINESVVEAIEYFGTKIKGYNNSNAILAAVESRTSSPIRILRDEECVSNINGLYPCGEGAGYAGGITSAAVDGVKIAERIASVYKN